VPRVRLPQENQENEEPKASSARAFGAAESLTGGLIGFGLLGYLLDLKFGTGPAFLLTGLGLALIVGFYQLYKVMLVRSSKGTAGDKPGQDPGTGQGPGPGQGTE
jgi:F0F1-type ATP synthase assembly protein I